MGSAGTPYMLTLISKPLQGMSIILVPTFWLRCRELGAGLRNSVSWESSDVQGFAGFAYSGHSLSQSRSYLAFVQCWRLRLTWRAKLFQRVTELKTLLGLGLGVVCLGRFRVGLLGYLSPEAEFFLESLELVF